MFSGYMLGFIIVMYLGITSMVREPSLFKKLLFIYTVSFMASTILLI